MSFERERPIVTTGASSGYSILPSPLSRMSRAGPVGGAPDGKYGVSAVLWLAVIGWLWRGGQGAPPGEDADAP